MHNNYYFLRRLTEDLQPKLIGSSLKACFSQNKNELIIIFDQLIIKAYLTPSFCCLAFPSDFHRARKNSVDLFEQLVDKKVTHITQYLNERCFSLDFEEGFQLLFKMHGNRSNIILISEGRVTDLFISKLSKDWEIKVTDLDRKLDQSYEALIAHEGEYKMLFPTFGKEVQQHLERKFNDQTSIDEKWNIVQGVLDELSSGNFHIASSEHSPQFTLIKPDRPLEKFTSPIEAINFFFNHYVSQSTLSQEKREVITKLASEIKRLKNYITKSEKKLDKIEHGIKYNHIADILMANLHTIKNSSNEVFLPNFYQNNEIIEIKLKRDQSTQQNAENYYKKSKNQSLEIQILKENIDNKTDQLFIAEERLQHVQDIDNLKELRKYLKTEGFIKVNQEKQISRPYFQFEFMGFDIFVGKSAKANDELLRHYTYKEDLWLHAKDVSGSHVIIKHKAGQVYKIALIERAAELAAYYSKRKSDTLCPVIYTPRKFIRKRKNDPPGAVVVEKENVILVEPKKQ